MRILVSIHANFVLVSLKMKEICYKTETKIQKTKSMPMSLWEPQRYPEVSNRAGLLLHCLRADSEKVSNEIDDVKSIE